MQVPFLDLKAQLPLVREEIEARFSAIIDNTGFVCGKHVAEFEGLFARAHGAAHAVGLSSGTDANHLAMLCAGVKPGDDVLVPANTFIATAEGVTLAGARPVFTDIEETTFNMDPAAAESAVTGRTRAINPVHLYGCPADIDALEAVAAARGLTVVEDAAQAHLARYKDRPIGGHGHIVSWSFYPGKNLGAWGEGGAVTLPDDASAEFARKYRNHGSAKKYMHDCIGHNYRMSEFQGAVLAVKMGRLEAWTEGRRLNAERYRERLADVAEVVCPTEPAGCRHVYHLFVIRAERRDDLQAHLQDQGVATGLHYPVPLHLTDAYGEGWRKGQFPVTEKLAGEILSLPMFPELTESQIDYVCDAIRAFYRG